MQKEMSTSHGGLPECLLCSEVIHCYGVFNCGHFVCDLCALRMRTFAGANANVAQAAANAMTAASALPRGASRHPVASLCPVCRTEVKELLVTSEPPPSEDGYPPATLTAISERAVPSGSVHARLDGDKARARASLLTLFFCPLEQCWEVDPVTGAASQDAFVSLELLKEHLKIDHHMKHCKFCLDYRPAFLSEQRVYTDKEMDQHHRGHCKKDPASFVGHPPCLFCGQRFYEGDALLKHMRFTHIFCELCNANEFIFVFYKNRDMLHTHCQRQHRVCEHRNCSNKDFMERTFRDELALQAHMAREHGEKEAKLSAASLGFNFSATTNLASVSPPPAGAAYGAGSTGTNNTHADRITFDFANGRVEDVFTTPVQRMQAERGRDGSGETMQDLRKRLSKALEAHLNPAGIETLKGYSKEFMEGKVKAMEYFKQLQTLLPEPEALNAVFAPLVATLPDAQKREALTASKTMLTSAEAVRHQRNQQEDDDKRRLEALRVQNQKARQQSAPMSSAKVGAARAPAPKGAWTKAAARVGNNNNADATSAPAQQHHHQQQQRQAMTPQPAAPAQQPTVWGQPPPPAMGNAPPVFLDAEAFPSLSTSPSNRRGGTAARAVIGGKPAPKSAWGARR
jgi:hypothetical protein